MRSGMFGKVRINWLNILSSYTCLYFSRPATRLPFLVQPDAGTLSVFPVSCQSSISTERTEWKQCIKVTMI